jgi:tetrahydromethanopterin S-methyltransferase subunit G
MNEDIYKMICGKIDSFKELVEVKLDNIEGKVDHTNGSVADAHKEIGKLKSWRSYITGGLTVITMLVVPILIFAVKGYIEREQTIEQKVEYKLEELGIKIDYAE